MLWYVVITHIALAIALFFLVNWLGVHSSPLGYMQMSIGMKEDTSPMFNYLFKVLAPVVFVVLIAALFQLFGLDEFCKKIYLIVVYYWVFRLAYVIFRGQSSLLDWRVQVLYWISSIGLAVWVYSLIDKLETILPTPQALIEQLWLLIILFIYSILNKMEFSRSSTERRKKEYINRQYSILHQRFGEQVDVFFKSDFLRALTFSIMIYENYNRSGAVRALERILFRKSKKKHTFGIMQVMSDRVMTDEESIESGMRKILNDCKRVFLKRDGDDRSADGLVYDVADEYNGGDVHYVGEVYDVFTQLREKYYPTIPDIISELDIF